MISRAFARLSSCATHSSDADATVSRGATDLEARGGRIFRTTVRATEAEDESTRDPGGFHGFLTARERASFFGGTREVGWAHVAGLGGVGHLDEGAFEQFWAAVFTHF